MDSVNMLIVNWPVCIIGIALAVLAVVFTFLSRTWTSALSVIALCITYFWGRTFMSDYEFYFWGAAALIAWAICVMLPKSVSHSRYGMGYMAAATVAGAFVGMILSHAGIIIGAVIGAFCGALAYSRTPAGRVLQFPSSKFLHYLCAKGLPAVVNVCILCIIITAVAGL